MAGSMDLKILLWEPEEHETQLFDIFDASVNASQSADATAAKLDKLFPAGQDSKAAEAYLWSMWTIFFAVVKKIPASDERQQTLVQVVKALKTKERQTVSIWGAESSVWGDLPMMGPCMREAWNLQPKFDGSEKDATAIAAWISLNSFSARLHGASVWPCDNFAIWGLRGALEEPSSSKPNERDANLATACQWFEHAGKVLYDTSREPRELNDADARSLRTGKALESPAGFNEKRWKFWKEKLAEMGAETEDSELQERAKKVAETMKGLEG